MSRGRHSGALSGGSIGSRLARILALPAAVVLILLGVVATQQVRDYRTAQSTTRAVDLTLGVQNLVQALQTERGLTAAVLGGNQSFTPELTPARRQVDQRRTALAGLVSGDGDADAEVRSALAQLDGLSAVRAAADSTSAGRAATFSYFTNLISRLGSSSLGLDRSGDEQLRRGVSALTALQDMSEAIAQERAFLNGVFSAGGFGKGEFVQFAAMRAARETAATRLREAATDTQLKALDFTLGTGAARTTQYFERVAVEGADGRPLVVNPQAWWSGLTTVLGDLDQLQLHIGSEIQFRAFELRSAAAERLGLLTAGVLLTLLASLYLAMLVSRSITRPLAALAAEAEAVAAERLPEAVRLVQAGRGDQTPEPPEPVRIPQRASFEIQSVAVALDRMQSAAYDLAIEQTIQRTRTIESLTNLGRRNQGLIRRQLGFITKLESEEIDPQALSNLFELDHLATRMRRNADSLLVLVGAASSRRWATPVPMADVIRAAVSEVEEYRRVTLRRVDDAFVGGGSVGAVAHLLSELIENGLAFSPPEYEVEVQGRQLPDGYLIAVTDQGVGMTTEELRQANSRLRGEGDFISAPTRFLGHFVVGELARLLEAEVELLPSPVVGVTARVTLPRAVLSVQPELTSSAPPAHEKTTGQPSPAVLAAQTPRPDDDTPPALRLARDNAPVVVTVDVQDVEVEAIPPAVASALAPPELRRPEGSLFERSAASIGHSVPPAATIRFGPDDARRVAWDDTPPHGVPVKPAPAAAAPAPAAAPPATGDPARTRNGLPKRMPREVRATTSSPSAGPEPTRVVDLAAAERARLDQAPSSVSARLTALRAGVRRGQEEHQPEVES